MFGAATKRHPAPVEIEISLGEREPPAGLVRVADGDPVPFAGWLGLLRVLSELMTSPEAGPDHR